MALVHHTLITLQVNNSYMMILLLILPLLLIFIALNNKFYNNKIISLRERFLISFISWSLLLVICTGMLSTFGALTKDSVFFYWMGVIVALLLVIWLQKKIKLNSFNDVIAKIKLASGTEKFLIACISIIILFTLFIGIATPPSNNDALDYHMPRVMHWIQNHSTAFYPTGMDIQLSAPPFAEYMITQFFILFEDDRIASLVQWFSMIISMLLVSLIAKEFGASFKYQLLSVFLAITIPMGLLQSMTTQNDYVLSLWILYMAYSVVKTTRTGPGLSDVVFFSASLGLAIFTKGTAYIYMLPFTTWFVLNILKSGRPLKLKAISLALLVLIPLAINLNHYLNNHKAFEHPLVINKTANQVISGRVIISNLIRNSALHFQTPLISINEKTASRIERILEKLKIDPNDPNTTFGKETFHIPVMAAHEDTTGNAFHFILYIVLIVILASSFKKKYNLLAFIYTLAVFLAILIFCLLLKWQPWHSRLHLTGFLLLAPLAGFIIQRLNFKKILAPLVVVLLVQSFILLAINSSRPLVPIKNSITSRILESNLDNMKTEVLSRHHDRLTRTIFNTPFADLRFMNNYDLIPEFFKMSDKIRETNAWQICLNCSGRVKEYLIWAIAKEVNKDVRIHYLRSKGNLKFDQGLDCDIKIRYDLGKGRYFIELP